MNPNPWLGTCMALLVTTASAQGTAPLNDTGMQQCLNKSGAWTTSCAGSGQDAAYGRDVNFPKDADGHAGFKYAKIDGTGQPVPRSAKDWRCVADRVTGLVWEVKTANGGIGSKGINFTNFGDGSPGDSSAFVAEANRRQICGASNWRLPTLTELQSLIDYSKTSGPSIDTDWFPNTRDWWYWASDEYATDPEATWAVYFSGSAGGDGAARREFKLSVRLVHNAP